MSLSLMPTAAPPRAGSTTPAALVGRLGALLASRGISYCQWKGHGKRERWENGRGDIDLLVDGRIVVELKAIEAIAPVHEAIVLTYLRLSGCRVGLLINFNVALYRQGIKRFGL